MNFAITSAKQLIENILGARFRNRQRQPYMMRREILILEELIASKQPKCILEWGSGYSTCYFPSQIKDTFNWLSLDHNPEWAQRIAQMNKNSSVSIEWVSEDEYLNFPQARMPFDLIIIDGIRRPECLLKSQEFLASDGLVFLHDANRVEYLPFIDQFRFKWLLTDYRRTAGGLAIMSNEIQISHLVDTATHERNWSYIRNRISKILAI